VDFFPGDGQSVIQYYHDILEDAAANKLLVNFHGATLPRGLHRTYPNFMTAEAVFGYEMITFSQDAANAEPQHAVMSALVRNAFDPMDFTPMNLSKIPGISRTTTSAFELATSVVYLSGVQHYAESPQGMAQVPRYVKDFLRTLPNSWDDVKFIDGFPGKLYVVARRAGTKWYVAGINGENLEKTITLNLSFLKNKKGTIIASATTPSTAFSSNTLTLPSTGMTEVILKGNDGFVMVFE
jgi:alpha-glucosidase